MSTMRARPRRQGSFALAVAGALSYLLMAPRMRTGPWG